MSAVSPGTGTPAASISRNTATKSIAAVSNPLAYNVEHPLW